MPSRIALTMIAVLSTVVALPAGAQSSSESNPTATVARGCSHADELPVDNRSRQRAARAVACLVNVERAKRRLPGLITSSWLRHSATYQAADMVRDGYFAHVSPSGETLRMRVRRTGYTRGSRKFRLGETSAWGSGRLSTPARLVRDLMNSRSHRRILVSRRYREIGVGLSLGSPRDIQKTSVTLAINFGWRTGDVSRRR